MQATGGATPLMYACQQCRENEVSDILRKQPYSVKDRDRTLKTPLHYCAENPNSSCAEAVLRVAPELVNAQDENGYCTLHLAVIAGNKPLIKLLLAKGADVNIHDNEGHSAVHWAIVSSEKEALEMIIRAGANPSTPDIHGGYPLHYAVQMCGCNCDYVRNFEDTVRVVETLLNFGVDVSVKDKDGRQPILWAASAGSADAIIHLVSGGACVEAADKDGLTALHCAASRGHTTALETLISLCGANVDVIDGNGCSALFYSVTLGHADATELLLQLGADPNRQDRKGRTPAHCGAAKGQLETLRILQKHGGNLWMRNVKGDIPLHEAVASGRKDLVLWLLSQCSEAINIANNDGRCPLHIASMYNNTEMVKVLLDCKSLVNPVMRTSKGVLMTPLNVALSKGHRSCGKYLQLHGGVPFSKVSKVEPASGFTLRVSPSDDAIIIVSENDKENLTPSQTKISKSRSSTDVQENREIVKGETTDKKKVYRRRKKKKNQSNMHTQDSDSDDSIHDVKLKTPESRKSEKNNEDEEDENVKASKAHLGIKKTGKSQTSPTVDAKTPSAGQMEVSEELTTASKITKSKTESKSLQRNKSFNETKNVSDLSPEDFPPMMQTVSHLDMVIMEPDIEVSKTENEKELKQQNVVDVVVSRETVAAETKEKEKSTEIPAKTAPSNGLPNVSGERNVLEEEDNSVAESKTLKAEITNENTEKIGKEESLVHEKSGKTPGVKKSNGSGRKDEGSRKSSDEGSVRKSSKSGRSSSDGGSTKKDSRVAKKSNDSSEGSEKRRKTPSPKDSKTVGRTEEKFSDPTINKGGEPDEEAVGDTVQDEKPKTEDEAIAKEIISADISKSNAADLSEEIMVSENTISDNKAERDEEAKSIENMEDTVASVIEKEEDGMTQSENVTLSPEKEETMPSETQSESIMTEKENPFVMTVEAEVNASETNDLTEMTAPEKNDDDVGETAPETVEKPEEKIEEPVEKPEEKIEEPVEKPEEKNEEPVEKPEEKIEEPVEKPEEKIEEPVEKPEKKIEEPGEKPLPEITILLNTPEEKKVDDSEITPTTVMQETVEENLQAKAKRSVEFSETVNEKPKEENKQSTAENNNTKELTSVSNTTVSDKDPANVSSSISNNTDFINVNNDNNNNISRSENHTSNSISTSKDRSGRLNHNNEEPMVASKQDDKSEATKKTDGANEVDAEGEEGSPRKKTSEERHFRTPRVSRLCRRNREFKDDTNQISVTQLVQNTIRKYHMERGIFYQLLELKRYQIRSGKANEQVLVKRLVDEYERSRVFLGMKPFTGVYKFREFEKFLYDQLKVLNSRRSFIIPEVKSFDDIDALSGFLKKSRYKIISETPPPEMVCTCITQRCHHSACAYTNVPCSAYITDLRRHRHHRPKRESFFPRIEHKSETQKPKERPATLELIQGSEKHVITLPQNSPGGEKRYYVTFTIKGAPGFKEDDFADESKDYFKHRHAKSV